MEERIAMLSTFVVATKLALGSGTLAVGAQLSQRLGGWRMDKAVLSRSARRLMIGQFHWPEEILF
jgi:2-methylaconitate cis-trans-isomerase PrpF